jgi:hypothetical protein
MLVICLILFGLLQLFYLSVAQMITDYSAFTSARSAAVGFADYIVSRNARVASIGASGRLITGDSGYTSNPLSQFQAEYIRIQEYLSGLRYIEYEYWFSYNNSTNTSLGLSVNPDSGGLASSTTQFNNYPINFPMKGAFTSAESTDIKADARIISAGSFFIE